MTCSLPTRSAAIPQLVQQLLDCGEAMQAARFKTATVQQCMAALALAFTTACVAQRLQLRPEAVVALSRSVGLLLGAGHECLMHLIAAGLTLRYSGTVLTQTVLMSQLLAMSAGPGAPARLASQFAAPQPTAAWLAAVTAATDTHCNAGMLLGDRRLFASAPAPGPRQTCCSVSIQHITLLAARLILRRRGTVCNMHASQPGHGLCPRADGSRLCSSCRGHWAGHCPECLPGAPASACFSGCYNCAAAASRAARSAA